jgi:hypothetical protein
MKSTYELLKAADECAEYAHTYVNYDGDSLTHSIESLRFELRAIGTILARIAGALEIMSK